MDNLISDLIRLESYKATRESGAPLSVLIADDERPMLHLLTISLKSLGHEVLAATDNGADAVILANTRQPDLIILDIEMPKMDGIEAAEQILAERSVPIIMSSGRSDNEVLRRIQSLNIQAYLVKPFGLGQLKSAVSVSLSQHEALLSARGDHRDTDERDRRDQRRELRGDVPHGEVRNRAQGCPRKTGTRGARPAGARSRMSPNRCSACARTTAPRTLPRRQPRG